METTSRPLRTGGGTTTTPLRISTEQGIPSLCADRGTKGSWTTDVQDSQGRPPGRWSGAVDRQGTATRWPRVPSSVLRRRVPCRALLRDGPVPASCLVDPCVRPPRRDSTHQPTMTSGRRPTNIEGEQRRGLGSLGTLVVIRLAIGTPAPTATSTSGASYRARWSPTSKRKTGLRAGAT